MSDRRKNIRVGHQAQVEVAAASGVLSAQSTDLSRTGIGVVVRVPEDYRDIRSITLRLPRHEEPLEIPVRLVRATGRDDSDDAHLLALEFEYDAEAQRLLIDQYVRDEVLRALQEGQEEAEARQVPRCGCSIVEVEAVECTTEVKSIDNLSTEGALVRFDRQSAPQPGSRLRLRFSLPEDPRPIETEGEVVYVIDETDGRSVTAGIKFREMREPYHARIRSFVVENASRTARQNMQEWFARNRPEEKFETVAIRRAISLFRQLAEGQLPIHAIAGSQHTIITFVPVSFRDGENPRLALELEHTVEPGTVSCSFSLDGSTYYFQSLIDTDGEMATLEIPEILYRGEVRSYGRKSVSSRIRLRPSATPAPTPVNGNPDPLLTGRILDISRRGFRCDVRAPLNAVSVLRPGTHVEYDVDPALALGSTGEIRHVRAMKGITSLSGKTLVLRIGIEAGIERSTCRRKVYSQADWERERSLKTEPPVHRTHDSKILRIRNSEGQEIVAVANANRWHGPATVFILPPAFGKKKEVLAPLSAVLLDNFSTADRSAVVIRYDGIDRPGESYNRNGDRRRGFEMLSYRVSQGEEDAQAVLEFAYDNPYFSVERLVLVTFSMSSLDGRKLILAEKNRGRVHLWMNVMGIPAARTSLGNILGGIDILANFRMGLPNGTSGMLGHLVNMDALADDLIRFRYAYLTDARFDMSRIDVPVCWIFGTFDRWVASEEVRDIMTVASAGARELIEIPTGHNLHTSDDALLCYKILTEAVFRHLFAENRRSVNPDREQMFRLIAAERERLSRDRDQGDLIDEYWRDYLLGKGNNSAGYDFYRDIHDFEAFLRREAVLLDVTPGARAVDLGCGTGIFLEALLFEIARSIGAAGAEISITAVDLVPEALEKARQKAEAAVRAHPPLGKVKFSYIARNLEPNRLAPVRRYIDSPVPDIGLLRGRIEGLRQETADRLEAAMTPELHALLQGEQPSDELLRAVSPRGGADLLPYVVELNRAARFVRGNLFAADLLQSGTDSMPTAPVPAGEYCRLRTDMLRFDKLWFGHAGREPGIGFTANSYERVVASLFVSYLFNPEEIFPEIYRMLAPGGIAVVSSMKPDSDISVIFTDFVGEVQARSSVESAGERELGNARAMLNEAASLFELAEEGLFRFFTGDELDALLREAGFEDVTVEPALGNPPQAFIARGRKPVRSQILEQSETV